MTRNFQHARLILFAGALSLLAGCNVGPKYARPNVTAPPTFRGADEAAITSSAPNSLGDEQWSTVYREPELQELDPQSSRQQLRRAHRGAAHPRATGAGQHHPRAAVSNRQHWRHRHRRHLAVFSGIQHSESAGERIVQCIGGLDTRLLGPVPQADRSGARPVAGTDMGTACHSDDTGATGRDLLPANQGSRRAT